MSVSALPSSATHAAEPLALYIHWPFCVSKCPYCDFNSHVRDQVDTDAWRGALLTDMAHEAALTRGRRVTSIFFGGGTPSLMPPALVADLIAAADRHWGLSADVEITLEANPNSVEAARFADLGAAGVNRVSLGLQALNDEALQFLGRAHGVDEGLAALTTAQRVFDRVSFDLIYARPGQSEADWEAELAQALGYGTGHLSLYQLTIEPGTRFATLVAQGKLTPADPDHGATLYELTQAMTGAAGIPAYEISNHARPGQESRHNLTYWRYGDYVGIGPGAHDWRTPAATAALRGASDVVGYGLYLDLIEDLIAAKNVHSSALGAEEDRARQALDLAAAGAHVALVSSGDAGIYALATLVFELLDRDSRAHWNRVEVSVTPGISAMQAAAARIGAPLGHDFCAISLSDLLTPLEDIRRRLQAAAAGDFVVALYNPVSKRRKKQLVMARDILLSARPRETPVVLARNLGRDGEAITVITLAELEPAMVDMLTLVLIGSSNTRVMDTSNGPRVYTPRGYAVKMEPVS